MAQATCCPSGKGPYAFNASSDPRIKSAIRLQIKSGGSFGLRSFNPLTINVLTPAFICATNSNLRQGELRVASGSALIRLQDECRGIE